MKRHTLIIVLIIINCFIGAIYQDLMASQPSNIVFHFSKTVQSQSDLRERAVAFHTVTFINPIAKPLGQITFGTTGANTLQGDGWFGNETSQKVGSIQWAGGPDKQAVMQLSIPDSTEGLLLKIYGIEDNLRMTVIIDGDTASVLLVDAYWHSGYVPVGEAVPEPVPETEPLWSEDQYFPTFPSTDRIYVFPVPTDLDKASVTLPSWRINQFYREMMTLTLVGMQGIINRHKPRVYLDFENNLSDASRFWIPYLEEHVQVVDLDLDFLSAVHFLLRRYNSRFTGAVIYDPEVPETINLATMIAGLENRLILAPKQLDLPGIPEFSSTTDLRLLAQAQGWDDTEDSKVPIYQWVYDNLWQNLEKRIIGVISPGPPVSGEYMPGRFNPLCLAQREYMIALKLSALFLDGGDSLQAELYGNFLAETPSPIPVTGVSPFETTSMPLVSQYGNWNACLSYPADATTGNLSVFSGVQPDPKPNNTQINGERILSTLGSKPVAMMFCSDGDNLSMQIHRGFHGGPDWVWEKVQGTRYGWTMNPTLINLAPVIWNFYVDSRDQVEFVCGISGAGATLIDYMNPSQLQNYVMNTSTYLDQTGFRTIFVHLDKIAVWTNEMSAIYYDGLGDTGYLGAIAGRGRRNGLNLSYAGVPTPACGISYTLEAYEIDEIVAHITSRNTDQIIFDFGTYPDHKGIVIQDTDATNGQAALFSDESTKYVEVIMGPGINLAPGDYTATFRFKVSNIQSSQDFIDINIGRMKYKGIQVEDDGWEEFARKSISPNDFQEADKYQLIQIPFTLDKLKTDIEVIMQHRPSAAQITADYFSIKKNEPDNFPVFAALLIPLLSADRMTDVPRQFAEKFETAGGILLTPDEFMAALNPEFMVDFAIPYLGANHPALTQANQQLAEGKYFASLLTVRNALSVYLDVESDHRRPRHFELSQNFPNPFNSFTSIRFTLPCREQVKIVIYSILGERVNTLIDRALPAGNHEIRYNAQNISSGVYFYKIKAGSFESIKKMLYLK